MPENAEQLAQLPRPGTGEERAPSGKGKGKRAYSGPRKGKDKGQASPRHNRRRVADPDRMLNGGDPNRRSLCTV